MVSCTNGLPFTKHVSPRMRVFTPSNKIAGAYMTSFQFHAVSHKLRKALEKPQTVANLSLKYQNVSSENRAGQVIKRNLHRVSYIGAEAFIYS